MAAFMMMYVPLGVKRLDDATVLPSTMRALWPSGMTARAFVRSIVSTTAQG